MENRAEEILKDTDFYMLVTNDKRSFPSSTTLSEVFIRQGIATLKFFIDSSNETVENIKLNPKGSISCLIYTPDKHIETLALKGHYELDSVEEYAGSRLDVFKSRLDYRDPVIVSFETTWIQVNEVIDFSKMK